MPKFRIIIDIEDQDPLPTWKEQEAEIKRIVRDDLLDRDFNVLNVEIEELHQ